MLQYENKKGNGFKLTESSFRLGIRERFLPAFLSFKTGVFVALKNRLCSLCDPVGAGLGLLITHCPAVLLGTVSSLTQSPLQGLYTHFCFCF